MRVFEELTRRRLIQTAALYVAVAWGGTEILVFLIDSLLGSQAAAAAQRYLAILLIAGFPAAMYLAWTRDLGLKARRLLSAGVVAVLIVALLVYTVPEPTPDSAIPVTENSIAVLPFEVCEARLSDRTLAGGLTGAVFNRLAQRDRLNVMGRRSVETVAETAPSITAMAELLGVEYLLNGIVCRDGLDLTLSAELTDHKGFVVWEEQFRQVVNRFDQVEAELASLVDNGVAAELGDVIAGRTDAAVDRRALEHFLIGYEYLRQRQKEKARAELEKALAIQPDYAEALHELAWATADIRLFENQADGLKHVRASTEKALVLVSAELQRDPRSFNSNRVAGRLLYALGLLEDNLAYRDFHDIGEAGVAASRARSQENYAQAEQHFRSALAINPSAADVRVGLASSMARQGVARRRESLDILLAGLDRDPFNHNLSDLAAFRLVEFGRFHEAMEMLDRFDVLPQGKGKGVWWTQLEILTNQGLTDQKLAKLIEILDRDPKLFSDLRILYHLWWAVSDVATLGLAEEAESLYENVSRIPNPEHENAEEFRRIFLGDEDMDESSEEDELHDADIEKYAAMSNEEILKTWHIETRDIASALWEAGERERAIELLEALQHYPSPPTTLAERQMMVPMQLVGMYIETGREDDAAPVLQYVVEHLQAEVDAGVRHHMTLWLLAEAYSWQRNYEAALRMLDLAVDYGGYDEDLCCMEELTDVQEPTAMRWWHGLEDDPRFMQTRARMRALVEQQRANIRSLLALHDMEALVSPLVEPE